MIWMTLNESVLWQYRKDHSQSHTSVVLSAYKYYWQHFSFSKCSLSFLSNLSKLISHQWLNWPHLRFTTHFFQFYLSLSSFFFSLPKSKTWVFVFWVYFLVYNFLTFVLLMFLVCGFVFQVAVTVPVGSDLSTRRSVFKVFLIFFLFFSD